MIYPYAFRKAYLGKVSGSALLMLTSGTTDTLQSGEIGLCLCPNGIEGNFISAATTTNVKMVMGSWATVDKIAPFYGGLTAPVYSRTIDFRRVTRFIKSIAAAAQGQIVAFGWNQISGNTTGPVFYCGQSYFLRLDIENSPALRLLNHQLYIDLPAYGGCCNTDCSSGCTSTAVDAACIMLQWKDFILAGTNGQGIPEVPYLKDFVAPTVWVRNPSTGVATQVYSAADVAAGRDNGVGVYTCNTSNPASVVASFKLTDVYSQTYYGNCTFTPSDFFETEPIRILGSLMTGDFGSPTNFGACAVNTTINTSVPNMFTQLQAAVYPRGLGEQVVREIIESERYRQNPLADSIYVDSFRMREIEDQTWMINNVNRQGYYDSIGIAYNIFRPGNEQAIHNNQQYFDQIYVPTGTNTTQFTTLFQACLTLVGSPVTLETI